MSSFEDSTESRSSAKEDTLTLVEYPLEPHTEDEQMVEFVDVIAPDSEQAEGAGSTIKKQIRRLKRLFRKYMKKVERQKRISDFDEWRKNNDFPQNSAIYAFKAREELRTANKALSERLFSTACSEIHQMLTFVQSCHDKSCIVSVRLDDFKGALRKKYDKNPELRQNKRHIKMITKKLHTSWKLPRIPRIPKEQISASVGESAVHIDLSTNFAPYGFCDDLMFIYFINTQRTEMFDDMARSIMETRRPRLINFTPLTQTVKDIADELGLTTPKQQTVVHTAVTRFFFERFYLLFPDQISAPDPQEFHENCARVRKATPSQMDIGEKFLKPEMMTQTWEEIVNGSSHLLKAIEWLRQMPFHTNFYDIIHCAFMCIKSVECFVRKNGLEKTFGAEVDEMMNIKSVNSDLAFDDLLPIFCGVYVIDPPRSSMAIAKLLEVAYGVDMSPSFQFGKMFFTSAVNTISENVDQLFVED